MLRIHAHAKIPVLELSSMAVSKASEIYARAGISFMVKWNVVQKVSGLYNEWQGVVKHRTRYTAATEEAKCDAF